MKWLKCVFDFYLDASIHVALAVFSLVLATGLIMNFEVDEHLSFSMFFGTMACYNFVKYGVEAEKYILVANRYHKNIQFMSFIALILALYHAFFLTFETWLGLGVIFFLTGLYAVPILPKTPNLRNQGLLKIILVGLVWAIATVILPVIAFKKAVVWDVYIEAFQRFVLVLILLVPFEIRDLKYDSPELRTLPQRYGATHSKSLAAMLGVLFYFLSFSKDSLTLLDIIGKGILFLGLGVMMYITKRNQTKYFASFWVEAIPIGWLIVLWLLESYI
ncbi:MAG: hypothetical protein QM485_10650 [Flavobacteriaceae bacterium]